MKLLSIIVSSSKLLAFIYIFQWMISFFSRSLQRFIEEELRPDLPDYIKQVEYPDFLEVEDFDDVDEDGQFFDADELFAIQMRKVSHLIYLCCAFSNLLFL